MFLSFESSNARKISFERGGGNQDPGDPEKLGGGWGFFSLQAGGELTLDDTMSISAESFSLTYDLSGFSLEIIVSNKLFYMRLI